MGLVIEPLDLVRTDRYEFNHIKESGGSKVLNLSSSTRDQGFVVLPFSSRDVVQKAIGIAFRELSASRINSIHNLYIAGDVIVADQSSIPKKVPHTSTESTNFSPVKPFRSFRLHKYKCCFEISIEVGPHFNRVSIENEVVVYDDRNCINAGISPLPNYEVWRIKGRIAVMPARR